MLIEKVIVIFYGWSILYFIFLNSCILIDYELLGGNDGIMFSLEWKECYLRVNGKCMIVYCISLNEVLVIIWEGIWEKEVY